jgi:hypothetical protein
LVDGNDLGVVLWISGWSPWNYGGGGTGGGSYDNDSIDDKWRYIIENGKVTRGSGTRVIRPPVNRWTASAFSITAPANQTLNVDPAVPLNIQWTQYQTGKGGYKIQIKDLDTGAEVYVKPEWPIEAFDLPANTLALSKQYTIKVWAITRRDAKGKPSGWVSATNTRTFTTRLTTPTNLAPTGAITTLTPTFTCDAVVKAVRYKVRIYDAAGTTLLHTSIPLLLPSYPLGAGVLADGTSYKWTFTAYPDTVCTAAYGVESDKVRIYKIELDDTLADGTVGTAYTGTVTATGGTGPYTYAVTSGTLPAGLSLSSGGAVSGTPTTAATSAFTVTATDANGDTGSRAYSVTVAALVLPSAIRIVGYVYATTFAGHGLDGNTSGPWDGAFPVKGAGAYEQTEFWMDDPHSTAAATFSSAPDVTKAGSYWEMRLDGWKDGSYADLWHGRLYSSSPVGQYDKVSGAAPVSSVVTEGYTP